MKAWICTILGHNWREGWAGARSGTFGAIVVNLKICKRCGEKQHELTTHLSMKGMD